MQPGRANTRVAILAALLGLLLVTVTACESPGPPPVRAEKEPGEPIVRVRIERSTQSIAFKGPSRLQIHAEGTESGRERLFSTPLRIRRSGGQWTGPWSGQGPAGSKTLVVRPLGPAPLVIGDDDRRFPGAIHLVPGRSGQASSAFDAVNHLRLEAYLPGVLDRELYSHWRPATFLAQAIVARSYAIDRISRGAGARHFDMENTTTSQAYSGQSGNPLAVRAVADTMGLVLTHNGDVLPAFYSSTCGGIGQAPADAFGGESTDPAPLQPGPERDWCSISNYYRWGPVERGKANLSRRIALWGRHNGLSIANLGTIREITISRRNAPGRPTRFDIVDDRNKRYRIRADSLRHACNHKPRNAELPAITSDSRIRSGFFEAEVSGSRVIFRNGRGFGHGVGLCQYGAEGMARAGRDVQSILQTFYPGTSLKRAY